MAQFTTDRPLAQFARTGSHAAFAKVVHAQIDLVYAAARRQLIDPATADDVTQQVFLLLARKASQVDERTLPGWLLNTARFCSKDANRQHLRRQQHEREAAMMRTPSANSSAAGFSPKDSFAVAERSELLERIDEALETLSLSDRTAIALRYLQQKPTSDVAIALGISSEAAKKRLARAMKRLRGRLAPLRQAATSGAITAALEQANAVTAPPTLASSIAGSVSRSTLLSTGAAGAGLHLLAILKWLGVSLVAFLLVAAVMIGLVRSSTSSKAATTTSIPAPMATTRALTSLDPQQRQILDLISQTRMEIPPDRPEEWIATLQELTQIGPSAVPALCAELDRAEHDGQQRLLLMALRIIGDARAVPAVIRAISRVPASSSDYVFSVPDPKQRHFLDSHYWHPPANAQYSSFSRGITECVATLEAITHHSEGQDITTDRSEDAEFKDHADQFTDQWQQWWDQHQADFVTTAQLATIDAAKAYIGLVAEVDEAYFRTLFPTGARIDLSPVVQRDVPCEGFWDSPSNLNLVSGKLLKPFEVASNSEKMFVPSTDAEADLFASIMGGPDVAQPDRHEDWHIELASHDMKTWPIDNARFNTIADEVRQSASLKRSTAGPFSGLWSRDPATGRLLKSNRQSCPATFLFETRSNRSGILQLIGPVNGETAFRVRYRLWPEIANNAFASHSAQSTTTAMTAAAFGEVHEATLFAPASGHAAAINLTTGATLPQTVNANKPGGLNLAKRVWAGAHHIDLITETDSANQLFGLSTVRAISRPISDAAWQSMTVDDCMKLAQLCWPSDSRMLGDSLYLPMKDAPPNETSRTWIIIDPDDHLLALLQMDDVQPTAIRFHYKLVPTL